MSARLVQAVGIDLGTTYSVVAHLDELSRPQTLLNAEGDKLTPSVVLFEGDRPVVGKEAVNAIGTEAEYVADCAKRFVGERMYHKVIEGRQYPPETIQAWILNKLRADAQWQIGAFNQAVITVPAYFDEVRRKATQDAGYIAGLDVLDIINEPTAAAIAFGSQRGNHSAAGSPGREQILVYDLGGGTFDVTVMEIDGNHYTTLATDGDVRLGGWDWDQRIIDHVAEESIKRIGIDPREEPNAAGRLWRECETAKRTLSARSTATIACDGHGRAIRVDLTRETFQDLTRDLLERTAFTTRQTLQAAGLNWSDLSRVLLIGGSTRMPAVEQMLCELTGLSPDRSVSPDEAVAHGAALHAGLRLHGGVDPQFQITNVNSHSLGVVGRESGSNRDRNAILIPRNTPLPTVAKQIFKTHTAAQRSIRVQIVEGESAAPADCSEIGKCSVHQLPANLPAQTPVEVEFRYAENGRLTVFVSVADHTVEHTLDRPNSLTQEELDRWRQLISGVPW